MKIPIAQIQSASNPVRTSEDKEKMDELIQSIAQQGLIVPIKVRPTNRSAERVAFLPPLDNTELVDATSDIEAFYGEAEFEVVYGHRRLHACKELGLAEIECIVEGVDDRNHLIQALTENVVREDMSEPDIARSIRAMKEDYGITNAEIAKMLGWSENKIKQLTLMMSGEVGKVLEGVRGHFPYHYAIEAKAGAKDDKLAAQVVKKAIDEGLNRNQIRKVAEAASIAETPEERQAILETPIDNPMFDRIVRAKARAETERKAQEAERHLGNTQEVKQFMDAMKAFEKAIREVMEAIDYNKFSPEGIQYTLNRLEKVTESISDLTIKLMEAKQ